MGFRNGRSQHQAIQYLREQCWTQNIQWIISADITGLFDNINKNMLKDLIRLKINDGKLIRLIGKWLNAGVMEDNRTAYRHEPAWEQSLTLCSKLRGFYQYYGVRTNFKALETVFESAEKAWGYWPSKRSQRSKVRMAYLRRKYPLPKPRILRDI